MSSPLPLQARASRRTECLLGKRPENRLGAGCRRAGAPLFAQALGGREGIDDGPKHPRSLGLLYVFYGTICVVERTWRFAIPLLMGRLLCGDAVPSKEGMDVAYESVAVVGFWAQTFMFSSGMWIGGIIDSIPRKQLLRWVLCIQSVAVIASCLFLLCASPGNVNLQTFRSSWLFKGLAATCIIERLSALGSDVSLERDWVVVLVGKARTQPLARANATLRGIDMACESIGPVLFALVLQVFGLAQTAFWSMAIVALLVPLQLLLLDSSYKGAFQSLRKEFDLDPTASTSETFASNSPVPSKGRSTLVDFFTAGLNSWKLFFRQKSFLVAFSHVLLRSSILYPGTMMVVYLAAVGMQETSLGIFRGSCAFSSFLATCVTSLLIKRLGLFNSGSFFISFEVLAGICAALAHLMSCHWIFTSAIVVSRLGHTAFEMVSTQIVQQSIPSHEAGAVNACEIALSSLFEVMTYALVIAFCGTPEKFSIAVYYSLVMLALALFFYGLGVKKLENNQNTVS